MYETWDLAHVYVPMYVFQNDNDFLHNYVALKADVFIMYSRLIFLLEIPTRPIWTNMYKYVHYVCMHGQKLVQKIHCRGVGK
jgi:hypothetical protein